MQGDRTWVIGIGIPLTILAGIATHMTSRRSVARQAQLTTSGLPTGQAAIMNKLMLYVFPLFVILGGPFFPLAILIYWLSNNSWTFGQLWAGAPDPGPEAARPPRCGRRAGQGEVTGSARRRRVPEPKTTTGKRPVVQPSPVDAAPSASPGTDGDTGSVATNGAVGNAGTHCWRDHERRLDQRWRRQANTQGRCKPAGQASRPGGQHRARNASADRGPAAAVVTSKSAADSKEGHHEPDISAQRHAIADATPTSSDRRRADRQTTTRDDSARDDDVRHRGRTSTTCWSPRVTLPATTWSGCSTFSTTTGTSTSTSKASGPWCSIIGEGDLTKLVGDRGEVLDALQELTRLAVDRRDRSAVPADARHRRLPRAAPDRAGRAGCRDRAQRAGRRRAGAPVADEPVRAQGGARRGRRVDGVSSSSEGEEPRRRVVSARRPDAGDAAIRRQSSALQEIHLSQP